jgi:dipeptidyl aminopeptidase/acylaminoacyl peptidase
MKRPLSSSIAFALAATACCVPAAEATFPGEPGPIAFERIVKPRQEVSQIFAVDPHGGAVRRLSTGPATGHVPDYSPDGTRIAFERRFGGKSPDAIWTMNADGSGLAPIQTTCSGECLGDIYPAWSPDGARLVFSRAFGPIVDDSATGLDLMAAAADGSGEQLIRHFLSLEAPGREPHDPQWSPDGKQILFSTAMGNERYFANNTRLAVVPATGGTPRSLTDSFDENPGFVAWNGDGIYFTALQKTASHLFRLDPQTAKITRVTAPDNLMGGAFSLTRDGRRMAFSASSPVSLNEVFISDVKNFSPRALTNMTEQAKAFTLGVREVISWKSQDGAVIEGVLIKPADFDPSKKYPLLCIIHGGPTGIDRPSLLAPDTRYYPSDIWAGRGALILKVNYRGSAGYGENFRRLNVRNLGVGDAWDVLSGVDHLIAKGWVDPKRVGCMGWSQGGYISAFLTTSTDRFAAISVGAGISNWATYYYNTDITPFTINYLGKDPAEDPEIYEKTSPMSYIKKARTPTLIQHGEFDRRVPIANAYELRQGLEDRGVKVEMVVYKGYGHGITKPRSMRAVMQHNLDWFNHYIWGDPLPDFASPALPKKEAKQDDRKAG